MCCRIIIFVKIHIFHRIEIIAVIPEADHIFPIRQNNTNINGKIVIFFDPVLEFIHTKLLNTQAEHCPGFWINTFPRAESDHPFRGFDDIVLVMGRAFIQFIGSGTEVFVQIGPGFRRKRDSSVFFGDDQQDNQESEKLTDNDADPKACQPKGCTKNQRTDGGQKKDFQKRDQVCQPDSFIIPIYDKLSDNCE